MAVARTMLRIGVYAMSGVGLAAIAVAAAITVPVTAPPPLASIDNGARAVNRSGMPALSRFQARDGTELAYRRYKPQKDGVREVAIVIHGSAGSSIAVHALAQALAARGVETFAPDIRGHGGSGTRGDIGHRGQLADDFADLVAMVQAARPGAPLVLLGHSSGGGFALRMAGSPVGRAFARTVLLAPYLGYREATNRPGSGGWAAPDMPRIVALQLLQSAGIACCDQLPVIAFAVPPGSEKYVTTAYSFRLLTGFGPSRDFRSDLAGATSPITAMIGAADELMQPENYQSTLGERVQVKLLPGVDHMGIVADPAALSSIADVVVGAGAGT
ncbi:alpha/beta hydrolase [Rhodopseudomonas sp. B29]|uniref:alpha/beta hydrolase n=1 Tax=Rhodopseudomonas sp. B29 TaxID=95607 RepID=UPI00034639E7|nr:alpha/beta hydrolase [Rhodopseudomonas sp. B29]